MFQRINSFDNHLKIGVALKKSKFLSKDCFFSAMQEASQCCEYVFIDYEGARELLSPSEVASLLKILDNKLVLTIAVRGLEFHKRGNLLANYLRLALEWDNLRFCFVPGHPAYHSIDKSILVEENLHRFIEATRDFTRSEIFFGVENVPLSVIRRVWNRHENVVPFVLNGDHRLSRITKNNDNMALYSPFTTNSNLYNVAERMRGYLLRRQWTLKMLEKNGIEPSGVVREKHWMSLTQDVKKLLLLALDHFTLTDFNLQDRLLEFVRHQIKYLVLYPITLDDLSC